MCRLNRRRGYQGARGPGAALMEEARDPELLNHAVEVRLKAERKAGEKLRNMPKASGGEYGGRSALDGSREEPSNPTPTLH
jgi:hypothetical protein